MPKITTTAADEIYVDDTSVRASISFLSAKALGSLFLRPFPMPRSKTSTQFIIARIVYQIPRMSSLPKNLRYAGSKNSVKSIDPPFTRNAPMMLISIFLLFLTAPKRLSLLSFITLPFQTNRGDPLPYLIRVVIILFKQYLVNKQHIQISPHSAYSLALPAKPAKS